MFTIIGFSAPLFGVNGLEAVKAESSESLFPRVLLKSQVGRYSWTSYIAETFEDLQHVSIW